MCVSIICKLFSNLFFKNVKVYIDNRDGVETENGNVYINGRLIEVVPGKPVLTPQESMFSPLLSSLPLTIQFRVLTTHR